MQRAGGYTLTLLGTPRIYLILQSLAEGAKSRLDLRREAGAPAQSTLRGHLSVLEATGVLANRRQDSSRGALEYELTEAGRELLKVSESIEHWLEKAPQGPLKLGEDSAKAAVKGLVDGWSTMVLTELAAGPSSLTELDKQISTVSYPTIERCLETMRLSEQLEVGARTPTGTPYSLSTWLRRGVAPLVLAAHWEHRNRPDGATPICQLDIEGALLLVAPMAQFPALQSGICQMAVRAPDGDKKGRAMSSVELNNGEIAFGLLYPDRKPDAWMSATSDGWFSMMIDADLRGLRLSGNRDLAESICDGLRRALFERSGATTRRFSNKTD